MIYSIDPEGAKDLDDAISLQRDGESIKLTTYIALPTSSLTRDDSAFADALEQRETLYFARGKRSMLPDALEAAHSLSDAQERAALEVKMRFDASNVAICKDVRVRATSVQVDKALTYAQARALLRAGDTDMRDLAWLSAQLFRARNTHALALFDGDAAEHGLYMTGEGIIEHAHRAHMIVAEAMILTNRALAEWCRARALPIMWRNHRAQSEDAGVTEAFAQARVRGDAREMFLLAPKLMHCLARATYNRTREEHFGLGLDGYAHFTSPLRRAADLINQAQILAYLNHAPLPFLGETLAGIEEMWRAPGQQEAIDEERAERSKKQHTRLAKKKLERTGVIYKDAAAFERLTKAMARGHLEMDVEELAEQLHLATRRGCVPVPVLSTILLEEGVPELVETALQALISTPSLAVSLWQHGQNIEALDAVRVKAMASGPDHAVRFSARVGDTVVHGGKKREAEQRAHVVLLAKHCGRADLLPTSWFEEEKPGKKEVEEVALPKLSATPSSSNVSVLNTFCLQAGVDTPGYAYKKNDLGEWVCEAEMVYKGIDVSAASSARSKKHARAKVAHLLIKALHQAFDNDNHTGREDEGDIQQVMVG